MFSPIDLEMLMRVPYVEPDLGYDISPDGSQVAFSWNANGRWEIYCLDLTSPGEARQISTGEGAKFAPRYSPNGDFLAYAVDLDGGENYDIFVYEFNNGIQTNLTPQTPEALTTSFAWSSDNTQLALCSDQDGRFDTYIKRLNNGEIRKVLNQSYPDWVVRWSPDGANLAVVSEAAGQDYYTTLVPADEGKTQVISINGQPISAKDAHWSPSGRQLAFASNVSGIYQIGIFDLETQQISWLTQGEGEKESPEWSPDGKRIVYVKSLGPDSSLVIQPINEVKGIEFQIEPGVIYGPSFTPDGERILFIFDNPRHPCDLWELHITQSKFNQLTFSLPEDINKDLFILPKQVFYPSLDGVDVPALLYLPTAQSPKLPPGVVMVHGGPNWLTQITWDPLLQHMLSRGWVVLSPNYRGSTGYGREWQLASRYDLGGVDTEDVVAGADYLTREDLADPKRVAVTGRSWGGYLTMTCLTQFPERWAAGSASVPFLNWFTSHANSRQDLQHWDLENFGDPKKDYDLWYQRSPYFFLDRIVAPVQLICGANDVRCPASESAQAHEQLTALGKESDYVVYPDEGHAFLKIETQIDAKKRRAEFLAKIFEREIGE